MFQHIYRARHRSGKYMVIESKGKLIRDENNMPVSMWERRLTLRRAVKWKMP